MCTCAQSRWSEIGLSRVLTVAAAVAVAATCNHFDVCPGMTRQCNVTLRPFELLHACTIRLDPPACAFRKGNCAAHRRICRSRFRRDPRRETSSRPAVRPGDRKLGRIELLNFASTFPRQSATYGNSRWCLCWWSSFPSSLAMVVRY